MIGTDLHDARKENSATILSHPQMDDSERRPCPATTATWADPSPDMIFYGQHHKNTATNLRAQPPHRLRRLRVDRVALLRAG